MGKRIILFLSKLLNAGIVIDTKNYSHFKSDISSVPLGVVRKITVLKLLTDLFCMRKVISLFIFCLLCTSTYFTMYNFEVIRYTLWDHFVGVA